MKPKLSKSRIQSSTLTRPYLKPKPFVSQSDQLSGAVYTNLQTANVDVNRIRKEKKEKVLTTKLVFEAQMLEKKKEMLLHKKEQRIANDKLM